VVEWWQLNPTGIPGTFALKVGVLDTGITDQMYQELSALIDDASRWQFRLGDRTTHKAVSTKHQDKKTGKLSVVTLDNADAPDGLPPVHSDRHIYPNKSAAEQAAKARLAAFNRSTAAVRLEMPGRTDVFAEMQLSAAGFKVGLDGEYLVDSVEQVFTQSGWSTTAECNGGKKGKAQAKGKTKKETKPLKVVSL
jgi:phage protein D